MVYEIMMPQLSDSMDEGKLIRWKVKVNDRVHIGDVIAEIESDKAIMEVQSFKNGLVLALNIKEGETVPVGTVILSIEIEAKVNDKEEKKQKTEVTLPDEEPKPEKKVKTQIKREKYTLLAGAASPKAKLLASSYGFDIQNLQKAEKLPTPAHENDIKVYHARRYFTPKALKLIEEYSLGRNLFDLGRKYDSQDLLSYIQMNNIALCKPLDPFQKALIKTVENSLEKPTYHIYEHIDATLLEDNSQYSMTVWLIRLFASAMMEFEGFRSTITKEGMNIWTNASISIAMAKGRFLYMPVFKNANKMSLQDIAEQLAQYQESVKEGRLSQSQMQGSSFSISNLGMTGIESFDAIINQDDSAIAAIGSSMNGRISVILTIDHRLVNGYEAALFMQRVKSLSRDKEFFTEL